MNGSIVSFLWSIANSRVVAVLCPLLDSAFSLQGCRQGVILAQSKPPTLRCSSVAFFPRHPYNGEEGSSRGMSPLYALVLPDSGSEIPAARELWVIAGEKVLRFFLKP